MDDYAETSAALPCLRGMSLFAIKPFDSLCEDSGKAQSGGLRRALGPFSLIGLGIGAIIGAGLFSLTGIAAAENAGPAVVLSLLVAAIGCGVARLWHRGPAPPV